MGVTAHTREVGARKHWELKSIPGCSATHIPEGWAGQGLLCPHFAGGLGVALTQMLLAAETQSHSDEDLCTGSWAVLLPGCSPLIVPMPPGCRHRALPTPSSEAADVGHWAAEATLAHRTLSPRVFGQDWQEMGPPLGQPLACWTQEVDSAGAIYPVPMRCGSSCGRSMQGLDRAQHPWVPPPALPRESQWGRNAGAGGEIPPEGLGHEGGGKEGCSQSWHRQGILRMLSVGSPAAPGLGNLELQPRAPGRCSAELLRPGRAHGAGSPPAARRRYWSSLPIPVPVRLSFSSSPSLAAITTLVTLGGPRHRSQLCSAPSPGTALQCQPGSRDGGVAPQEPVALVSLRVPGQGAPARGAESRAEEYNHPQPWGQTGADPKAPCECLTQLSIVEGTLPSVSLPRLDMLHRRGTRGLGSPGVKGQGCGMEQGRSRAAEVKQPRAIPRGRSGCWRSGGGDWHGAGSVPTMGWTKQRSHWPPASRESSTDASVSSDPPAQPALSSDSGWEVAGERRERLQRWWQEGSSAG